MSAQVPVGNAYDLFGRPKWVLVAVEPERGTVQSAAALGYGYEARFAADNPGCEVGVVPGPVSLDEPLTAAQLAARVPDVHTGLHMLTHAREQAAALGGLPWPEESGPPQDIESARIALRGLLAQLERDTPSTAGLLPNRAGEAVARQHYQMSGYVAQVKAILATVTAASLGTRPLLARFERLMGDEHTRTEVYADDNGTGARLRVFMDEQQDVYVEVLPPADWPAQPVPGVRMVGHCARRPLVLRAARALAQALQVRQDDGHE